MPWVSLYHIDFSRQLLNMRAAGDRRAFCAVPIFLRTEKRKATTLYVAMDDPTNEAALAEIAKAAGLPVKPMIASPNDIRSAIRVYYAARRARTGPPPVTTRGAPATSPASRRDLRRRPPAAAQPAGPPPASPSPPVTGRAPREASGLAVPPPAPPRRGSAPPPEPRDSPDADPELEVGEYIVPSARTRSAHGGAHAPRRNDAQPPRAARRPPPRRERLEPPSAGGLSDQLTARDLVSALRAVAHGADASEILGETDWQAMFAALLSLLLKKNLIADWEFVEELRNI